MEQAVFTSVFEAFVACTSRCGMDLLPSTVATKYRFPSRHLVSTLVHDVLSGNLPTIVYLIDLVHRRQLFPSFNQTNLLHRNIRHSPNDGPVLGKHMRLDAETMTVGFLRSPSPLAQFVLSSFLV